MAPRILSCLVAAARATLAIALLVALPAKCTAQAVVLESAQLGTIGRSGGTSITQAQHVGWRFEIFEPLAVERIGGHLLAIPDVSGDIFAALVRLPSINSLPQGAPFTGDELVVSTNFRPNFPSDEIFTPLSALLSPGSYALVFGTNQFGATGAGAIHNGPDQPDISPTTISSYIFWGIAGFGQPPIWRTNLASNMRFVIEGQLFDITADFNGDGMVDNDDLDDWQAAYSVNDLANADGDNDSDGHDFLQWQRQFGLFGSTPTSQAVPEFPSLILSIVGILLSCFLGRPDWRCNQLRRTSKTSHRRPRTV